MNFIIIGMNSVGKSKVGKLLSTKLNKIYFDEDDFFESQYGLIHELRKTLSNEDYQSKFLKIRTFFTNVEDIVLSAGGTTGRLDIVKEYNGVIIHLNPSLKFILKKYKKKKKDFSTENLRRKLVWETEEVITREYLIQNKLYQKNADITIDSSFLHKEEIVDLILEELKNKNLIKNY